MNLKNKINKKGNTLKTDNKLLLYIYHIFLYLLMDTEYFYVVYFIIIFSFNVLNIKSVCFAYLWSSLLVRQVWALILVLST